MVFKNMCVTFDPTFYLQDSVQRTIIVKLKFPSYKTTETAANVR
jgi:hypothetical protein